VFTRLGSRQSLHCHFVKVQIGLQTCPRPSEPSSDVPHSIQPFVALRFVVAQCVALSCCWNSCCTTALSNGSAARVLALYIYIYINKSCFSDP
jgi:hypothetical protein